MTMFLNLQRKEKEAIGLLSIGTFLEYFDLMLYVHMAVLLNELFFPPADAHASSLLAAFAFCSTWILRPFGAIIFGWVGDNIGRKSTVVITTLIMAFSCIVMASVPTYAQIGITAAWVVTACRVMQGMSAMGEAVGAEIYLTEITRPPVQYPVVGIVVVCSAVGSTAAALAVASFVTSIGLNWRIAFGAGALIALVGAIARTALKETTDFSDARRKIDSLVQNKEQKAQILKSSSLMNSKTTQKSFFALFLIQCMWPVCFYFTYVYCSTFLKNNFNLSAGEIIHHNFIVSLWHLLGRVILSYLSYKIAPLLILRVKTAIFALIVFACPFCLNGLTSPFELMVLQTLIVLFFPSDFPAVPIFYKHLPVLKRFTYACTAYAIGRSIMSVITAFGMVYLESYFGNWGLLVIMVPLLIGYQFGLSHFDKLEKKDSGVFDNKNLSLDYA